MKRKWVGKGKQMLMMGFHFENMRVQGLMGMTLNWNAGHLLDLTYYLNETDGTHGLPGRRKSEDESKFSKGLKVIEVLNIKLL